MADQLGVSNGIEESVNKFTLLRHLGILADKCVEEFALKSDLDSLKASVGDDIADQLNQLDETLAQLKSDVEANMPSKISDLENDAGYTTNTGTVTAVTLNGSTKNPTNGTVALGNLVSSINIDGTSVTPSSGTATITTALNTLIDSKIQAAIGDALAASY